MYIQVYQCIDDCSLSLLQTEFTSCFVRFKNVALYLYMTCMIRFTSYLSKVGGSLRTLASHTTQTGHHNIAGNCCTDIKPYERNKQLDSVFQEILLLCQQI